MRRKNWLLVLIIIVSVILLGVIGITLYNKSDDKQIIEGAKKEAIAYFKEKDNKKFSVTEEEFIKERSAIRVYGYFSDDKKQKRYVSFYYSKTDEGYTYEAGASGEVWEDSKLVEPAREKEN